MKKYDYIEKCIDEKDIGGLREAIGNLCYTSLDFSSGEFDEVIRYVESRGVKLKDDSLVGQLVSDSKASFTDKDFAYAVFQMKNNFCNERIADVKKISRILYGEPTAAKTSGQVKADPQTGAVPNAQGHREQQNSSLKWLIPVAVGAVLIIGLIVFLIVR